MLRTALKLGVNSSNTPRSMAERSTPSPSLNPCSTRTYRAHKISDTKLRHHDERHKTLVSASNFSIFDLKLRDSKRVCPGIQATTFFLPFFSRIFRPNYRRDFHRNHLNPLTNFVFLNVPAWAAVVLYIRQNVPTQNFRSKLEKLKPRSAFELRVPLYIGWTSSYKEKKKKKPARNLVD